MIKSKSFLVVAIVALVFNATLFANGSQEKGNYTLKVGTVLTENDPTYKGLVQFKNNVEKRTENKIEVQLYSGAQLGSDEDVLEQAKLGAGVGVITDPGRLSNYISDFGILGGPYIAVDYDESLKVMQTSVYKDMEKQIEDYGFKILSFNYFQGSRNLYTKNPVHSPSDLKGQRIRSSGGAIVTATLEALGANTTVMPWSEAYQALQQKVIEGVEVHNSAAVGASIYEVTNYLSETGHFQLLTGLVISNEWFNKLPKEYQTILMEESFNAGKKASQEIVAKDKEYLQKCLDAGMQLCEINKQEFIDASQKAYTKLGFEDMKKQIDKELGR